MLTPQKNYEFLVDCFKDRSIRSVGLEGGSRSGKSWDVACFIVALMQYQGLRILIARDTKSTLNRTTYATFKQVWFQAGLPTKLFTKYASEISFAGNSIDFVGMNDSPDLAQGLECDILWVNEADLCRKDTFDQLEQRARRFIIMDYNPRHVQNWVYEREKLPHHRILKTTILDNKYAPANAVAKIKSYEPTPENVAMGTADEYLWTVYGLGERTAGEDAVFTNVIRHTEAPKWCEWTLIGGDFGWSHDPTAAVLAQRKGNVIYLKLLMYETGLHNHHIAEKLDALGYKNKYTSVWDSANRKDIDDLIQLGVAADGAEKGPGSKAWGISKMQEYTLSVSDDPLSEILYQELIRLRWLKGKDGNYKKNSFGQRVTSEQEYKMTVNGETVRIKDDAIDAARYAITYFLEPYNANNDELD